ncbi:MAG: winged helix-turn-helix transcriptional regulator [Chloroflexi bacterium]|nr:winged helix-turn-helix transcriptional regulator [Chloroflexota bacterium]
MDTTHRALLARIADLYYNAELSQAEIGQRLDLSRVKIYRLLKEAREAGVVRISINWPIERERALERALIERFGLSDARVAVHSSLSDDAAMLRQVGRIAAQVLEETLHDGSTLAICLGRATREAVRAISVGRDRMGMRVAQAVGSIPSSMQAFDSATIGRELAAQLGGEVLYLNAPMMADSPESAEVIRRQPQVAQTLDAARNADVALIGIGSVASSTARLIEAGFIDAAAAETLCMHGAVGDIAGRMFAADGSSDFEHNRRVIGIGLDDLRRIPLTLGVACGSERSEAIRGALRTGALRILCTDETTAAGVLNS